MPAGKILILFSLDPLLGMLMFRLPLHNNLIIFGFPASTASHLTRLMGVFFVGVFFMVWEEGMGWRRNTKHKERAISGAFFMFHDGGGWRTSQTRRTHPYRCVLRGWEEGMGVEVLGEGGDVSRHKKKSRRTACCFPVPLWPLLAPPCVFRRVRCIFDASWPPHFVSSCCCRQGCLGGVSGLFQGSWGVVWRILALTRRVGDASGGGSGLW